MSKCIKRIVEQRRKRGEITGDLRWVQEELAELVVAISHYLRGRKKGEGEVVEEMAHVQVCMEFMKHIFKDRKKDIEAKYNEKIKRIHNRVYKEELHDREKQA